MIYLKAYIENDEANLPNHLKRNTNIRLNLQTYRNDKVGVFYSITPEQLENDSLTDILIEEMFMMLKSEINSLRKKKGNK